MSRKTPTCKDPRSAIFWISKAPHKAPAGTHSVCGPAFAMARSSASSGPLANAVGEPNRTSDTLSSAAPYASVIAGCATSIIRSGALPGRAIESTMDGWRGFFYLSLSLTLFLFSHSPTGNVTEVLQEVITDGNILFDCFCRAWETRKSIDGI